MKKQDKLLKKLERLRKEYTYSQDKRMIKKWEKEVKEAMAKKNLAEREPIRKLIKNLEKKVKDITTLLAWDKESIDDTEKRKALFVKREAYEYLLSFFTSSKNRIKSIEKRVDSEFKHHNLKEK